jgi:hypothetical protein
MTALLDVITDEAHDLSCDISWFEDILRVGPFGNTLAINVEILAYWDGDQLNVRPYGNVPSLTHIGAGLALLPDTLVMLDGAEIEAFEICDELEDYRKECLEADIEEKQNESERTR